MNPKMTVIEPSLAKNFKRQRVAAYARVSMDKETMLDSLSAQVSYYSRYIQSVAEWEFAGVYADEAYTGTKENRPEFQRLLDDCRAGLVDIIITKTISRFARNTAISLQYARELRALGIAIYFEEERINTLSEGGELLLTVHAAVAQEQSRDVSENCKWRHRKNFSEGKPNNFQIYGYDVHNGTEPTINESEAVVVRRVFAEYLAGFGANSISNRLNADGYRPRYGVEWTSWKVRKILRNEKYAGILIMQKMYVNNHLEKKCLQNNGELQKYIVDDNHDSIISRADFEQAQEVMNSRAKKFVPKVVESKNYQFTGKITCEICGKNYRRKISNAGSKYEKPVWICQTFNTKGKAHCASKQIPEDILTDIIGDFNFRAITAKPSNILTVTLEDGSEIEFEWENRSRRDSWTPEMKQRARKRSENYANS